MLFLDLDDFKPIKDRFGHEAGDRLLRAVAERVRACVRPEDTVARLGGDEFTILLEDIVDVRYAIGVAERIEEALREPFPIDGHEATVTASIGIAVSSGRDATPEDLMRNSDQAMYQAKRKGRARHELFALGTVTEDRSEGEAAPEEALVIEHVDEAPLDDGDDEPAAAAVAPAPVAEPPVAEPAHEPEPEPGPQPRDEPREAPASDDALGSAAAALTEARRRRRLRFPPRG